MNVTDPRRQTREELLEEAVEWLMRLRDLPSDAETTDEWRRWLALSSAHAAAWERACRTWQVLGALKPERGGLSVDIAPADRASVARGRALKARHRRGKTLRAAAIAIAFACIAAFTFGPAALLRFRSDYITGTGEMRTITLADGSTVMLGPASALAQRMENGTRGVSLLAGEAFFDVVHDEKRPFVVSADDAEIRVLGTAFNISETDRETRVELARGSVLVEARAKPDTVVKLAPGDAVTVDRNGNARRSHVDPLEIGLWREGRLAITDQPLGAVVAAIQRHHPAWIVIPDRAIATRRVSGLYDIGNPDKALAALVEPFGARVTTVSPLLRIISAK